MSDPNDTAREGGADAVRAEFDNIVSMGPVPRGFVFQGDEVVAPSPMLIKDLMPYSGLVFIGGQSGAGKSFIATDLAVGLATATPFFGRNVRERVGVVLIAAEGRGMIAARVEAARLQRAPAIKRLPISWTADVPELMTPEQIKKFGVQLRLVSQRFEKEFGVRLGVVIIDTVVATFDMEDEDNNSEAARTIRKMRELGRSCGATVVPVHHYGKSVTTGLRGGSSWRGGADYILSVLADRDDTTGDVKNRRLAIAKARDGEEGPIAPFALRFVQLDIDDQGLPFGTCVIEPSLGISARADVLARGRKPDRSMQAFQDAFTEVIDKRGVSFTVKDGGPTVKAANVQDVRREFNRRYATGEDEVGKQTEAGRKAFKRVLERLARQFPTEARDGIEWIWASK